MDGPTSNDSSLLLSTSANPKLGLFHAWPICGFVCDLHAANMCTMSIYIDMHIGMYMCSVYVC